jgi:hypothetical protein
LQLAHNKPPSLRDDKTEPSEAVIYSTLGGHRVSFTKGIAVPATDTNGDTQRYFRRHGFRAHSKYYSAIRRERYKVKILVARIHKVRGRLAWHASAFIDSLIDGKWQELPIDASLQALEFATEEHALAFALKSGQEYVDKIPSRSRLP